MAATMAEPIMAYGDKMNFEVVAFLFRLSCPLSPLFSSSPPLPLFISSFHLSNYLSPFLSPQTSKLFLTCLHHLSSLLPLYNWFALLTLLTSYSCFLLPEPLLSPVFKSAIIHLHQHCMSLSCRQTQQEAENDGIFAL